MFESTGRLIRRVRRYQSGNHNLYMEEEQTTQLQKEKVQKDKQRSTIIHITLMSNPNPTKHQG